MAVGAGGDAVAGSLTVPPSTGLPRHVLHVFNSASGGAALSAAELAVQLRRDWGIVGSAVCHDVGSPAERGMLLDAFEGRVLFTPLYWWNRKRRTAWWKRPLSELRQWWRTGCVRGSTAKVVDFARRQQADLIHTNTILNPEGGRAARRLGLPHVWHVRELLGDDQPFQLPLSGRRLRSYLLGHAERLIANSRTTADVLLKYCGVHHADDLLARRVTVVYNGIDTSRFEFRPEATTRSPIVVAMVGSLSSAWKRHDLFIEAAALVPAHLPVEFRLYGHAAHGGQYARQMLQLVAQRNLDGRFVTMGFVADPAELMRGIDVLVQPTAGESFGRTVAEAMAAGVPVVGVSAGACAELIEHQRTGLLAEPNRAAAIADCIQQLVEQPEWRARLATAARDVVRQKFSLAACGRQIADAYRAAMRCAMSG